MNELEVRHDNLPSTLPELSQFVLIGREKLASVRAEIRAIQKVGLAKEVLEQKRAEAQEIAELVTLSEVQLGRMLKEIPTSSGGDRRSDDFKNHDTVKFEKSKAETVKELGFNRQQVSQFQRMADHEDVVHAAIAEAKENDDIVSRSAVMKKIAESIPKPKTPKQMAQENIDRIKESSVIPFQAATIIQEEQAVVDSESAKDVFCEIAKMKIKLSGYDYAELDGKEFEAFLHAASSEMKKNTVEMLNQLCGCSMKLKNKIERSL